MPDSLQSPAFDLRWISCHHAEERSKTDEQAWKDYLARSTWFDRTHASGIDGAVAYFSMEFGAAEALPIYAGGLGVLAGDHLKAASDLGVPVVGVGLLYQHGYFRQVIGPSGEQRETFPYNDPATLPIAPLFTPQREPMTVALAFPGRTVYARAWQARAGRVPLYLLDTNDERNDAADRAIAAELYGGDAETRLQQEIVLGIGGWRLLEQLGIACAVCHLNEGHAAFAVLERARSFAVRTGQPFLQALQATKSGTLFTTHTAVAAGFDRFDPQLMLKYFRDYARQAGIRPEELLALGRARSATAATPFNMAYLAANGSAAVNAVSALHERVSRPIFQPVFNTRTLDDVPISHVTNGVHVPTWGAFGFDGTSDPAAQIAAMSDEDLWRTRERLRGALAQRFGLDPNAMIVCLSRRFTEYKRVTLLLRDPQRFVRLLNDPKRPIQLLVAGKAHPRDSEGRAAIRTWVEFTKRSDAAGRAIFVPDYDLGIAGAFTQGADVWLNTPRRPWEACGTSGMKAVMNGGLNLSTLDGWWDEAYSPEVGWALGNRDERTASDDADADQLYTLLEREIVPAFYARDARGIPPAWVAKMRASLSQLAPRFSASRMVQEYVERYYVRLRAAGGDGRLSEADSAVV
jgi:starch phosphorylase